MSSVLEACYTNPKLVKDDPLRDKVEAPPVFISVSPNLNRGYIDPYDNAGVNPDTPNVDVTKLLLIPLEFPTVNYPIEKAPYT